MSSSRQPPPERRIGLIGCVKSKRAHPAPARELYISPLFAGRRRCVEASCERWFILSALHGLVAPEEVLDPYELALSHLTSSQRRRWSERVLTQLELAVGSVAGLVIEIHAGNDYCQHGLVDGLRERGGIIDRRMVGLSQGQQLRAYAAGSCSAEAGTGADAGQRQRREEARPRSERAPAAGKYAALGTILAASSEGQVELSFAEIEQHLGFPLPPSARRYPAWWSSSAQGHSHARAWIGAGRIAKADLQRQIVRFELRT